MALWAKHGHLSTHHTVSERAQTLDSSQVTPGKAAEEREMPAHILKVNSLAKKQTWLIDPRDRR